MKQEAGQYRQKSIHAAAERVLTNTFGGQVRLSEPQGVWVYPDECRPTLQRAAVQQGPAGVPPTVIIKRINSGEPFDPDELGPQGGHGGGGTTAWRLIGEWSATQFLSSIPHEPPLGPHFYGGDRAEGFVVFEDLGHGPRVLDLLLGDDPTPAEAAILDYATALGQLHARTMAREADYERLRAGLGAPAFRYREFEADLLQGNWRSIEKIGDGLGLRWPAGIEEGAEAVASAARDPGPFLAFTHGDYAPANDMVIDGRVRLFDFEWGAFRHALFDGFVKQHLHPWREHCFPEPLLQRFEASYRAALLPQCPAAADAETFARADLDMRGAWMLRTIAHALPAALEGDHWPGEGPPADAEPPRPTVRQFLLLVLDGFADAAQALGHQEALGAAARCLSDRLRARWRPTLFELPLFPAFQNSEPPSDRSLG